MWGIDEWHSAGPTRKASNGSPFGGMLDKMEAVTGLGYVNREIANFSGVERRLL